MITNAGLTQLSNLGMGTGNKIANPDLKNRAKHDYEPKAGSPARDQGLPVAGLTTDLTGHRRDSHPDIGAVEAR